MSRIAGWIDSAVGGESPDGVLKAMADACAYQLPQRRMARSAASMALVAQGRDRESDLAAEEQLWTAIVGRPRWLAADLAAIAAGRGHAAALKEAYLRHGEELFAQLRGSFALAIIDGAKRRALLAVDRLGVERLCYSEPRTGGLVFGSTTDAVRAHPAVTGTVTHQAIFDYLYFAVCPSPGTIYREQSKLLPAQYLIFEDGKARTGFYWRMPYRESNDRSVDDLAKELMERLRTAVHREIAGENPAALGAFLSGGLDSSTVAGLLSEATGRRAKTFTIGFTHDKYDEIHYAEVAARHFGTEQHNYYLKPDDVVGVLAEMSRAFDEPFGNSSVMPTYYCAKVAREHGIELMLAGDGGDEIFAGNSRYVDQLVFGLYDHVPAALRRFVVEPIVFDLPGVGGIPLWRKARGYIQKARIPMPERLDAHNFYRNADLSEVLATDMLRDADPAATSAGLREAYERTGSQSMLHRMLHLDLKITLADNDLRKVGVACDLAGMPVAYPFLDDDVVEFSAQIPPSLLIRRLKRRWFFKYAVKDFLAPETLAKRKHGFGMPFTEWPRENPTLHEIAVECVRGFARRGYLRSDFLDRVIGSDGAYDGLVWDIVMLELWFREREATAQSPGLKKIVA
ncbi:MAG TPA: asparagine synthase-related protein [Stellaceae bacterium]|nr:asparagine synthase-related protein [Stellaceae bacterium]